MVVPLALSADQANCRAALWQLALGRLERDSAACALATARLMPYLNQWPVDEVLVVCADSAADVLGKWGDELGKNPACLGEAVFNQLHQRLKPPERLVLIAAWKTLEAVDPTGEAGRPHPECHPWPASTQVPSLRHAGGGSVFNFASTATQQTNGLEQMPAMGLCMATPEVLSQLAWGRSGSNPERMRTLVEAAIAGS